MLRHYHDKGLEYKVHWFVLYYRGKPFEKFVNRMVADRVAAIRKDPPDLAGQTVSKLLMNSCVGKFALAKHRFVKTQVCGIRKLYKAMRSPLLKQMKSLRVQDISIDPLHEVQLKKRHVIEDLAIQVQIQVYQNSKLLFFRFLDVLKKYVVPGSYVFTYCDTDSFLLSLTETELDDCIKPELKHEWLTQIIPKWFAIPDDLASQKEPGLLKEEARVTRGWFLCISPKCYIMADVAVSDLENQLIAQENEHKLFEIFSRFEGEPHVKILKKSAKGCNRKIALSFYEYLIAIFGTNYDNRIMKKIPQIQLDRKRDRMKTWTMLKKVINPILSKRLISDDKITTFPLRRADGSLF
jgi:hypothetical protein